MADPKTWATRVLQYAGFVALCVLVIPLLPPRIRIAAIAFIATAVILFFRNPQYYYRRLIGVAVALILPTATWSGTIDVAATLADEQTPSFVKAFVGLAFNNDSSLSFLLKFSVFGILVVADLITQLFYVRKDVRNVVVTPVEQGFEVHRASGKKLVIDGDVDVRNRTDHEIVVSSIALVWWGSPKSLGEIQVYSTLGSMTTGDDQKAKVVDTQPLAVAGEELRVPSNSSKRCRVSFKTPPFLRTLVCRIVAVFVPSGSVRLGHGLYARVEGDVSDVAELDLNFNRSVFNSGVD